MTSAFRKLLPPTALCLALCLASPPGSAADDFKLEDGYTLLFNGKDLTGWELGFCPPGTRPNDEKLDGKTASTNKTFFGPG